MSTKLMGEPASLSRGLQSTESSPLLVHSLSESSRSSVLSLAASDNYIFSGTQNQDISVWDKKTFRLKHTLRGHTGSVLALEFAKDKDWLLSSSGDSTIRVWCTKTLQPLYVIDPYMENCAGDLFSLAWSSALQTLYVGCQNTSLQWFNFLETVTSSDSSSIADNVPSSSSPGGAVTPLVQTRRVHKFFDSYPQHERKPADLNANNNATRHGRGTPDSDNISDSSSQTYNLSIPSVNVIDSAHYGYIYCMAILNHDGPAVQLATGSGDESVKLWDCSNVTPQLLHEFHCNQGAILTLVARDDTIYAGCQDGYVKVLDLETKTLVRTIIVHEGIDIISMTMLGTDLYTCSENGWVNRWSASFDCTASWKAHQGIALSSIVTSRARTGNNSGYYLLTGSNDDNIKVWEVRSPRTRPHPIDGDVGHSNRSCIGTGSIYDTMLYALTNFVSIPSVSSEFAHKEDCRQAAVWLKKCLGQLGAHTSLLPTGEGNNPIVLAKFEGSIGDKPKPRILFYGHYDVITAPPDGWDSDPFQLSGRNGYLYGRGVTDDKGPIIAIACAAANLLTRRALDVDLIFLIEGEAESGSTGFADTVRKHKSQIGNIDAILVSNSTWITDDRPCITYGLRGVIHCVVEISNDRPDLHSGIEGGAVAEPMIDMVKILSTLVDTQKQIQIPGFYDHVLPKTEEEEKSYQVISKVVHKSATLLESRWREPSLTVHSIEISGPKNATVIPGTVKAQLSVRIVPDQDLDTIVKLLCQYLQNSFDQLASPNLLTVHIEQTADWWLGKFDDRWFKCLESAVREQWGQEPLRIREGGSIPSVPYLEKEFGCHALHLPMGQSSDQAHLPNERISLLNLHKGMEVVERFLMQVAHQAE
ncbi:hypothetical protein CVT24_010948 [Panaeolus cyanescens]|uniref:Peptidase M20 dimerisation domain-containing protein n=1 Tax=Panaeolus cyanescens TaxID=181874 RepID=A0A409YVU6_9AGAR|nr:hypothetical protein CVT24_010948 [Panaeolus cyanescens]